MAVIASTDGINVFCSYVFRLTRPFFKKNIASMKQDSSNIKKKTTQLTKEYEEHMLLLEGGDKTKHTTFDC